MGEEDLRDISKLIVLFCLRYKGATLNIYGHKGFLILIIIFMKFCLVT